MKSSRPWCFISCTMVSLYVIMTVTGQSVRRIVHNTVIATALNDFSMNFEAEHTTPPSGAIWRKQLISENKSASHQISHSNSKISGFYTILNFWNPSKSSNHSLHSVIFGSRRPMLNCMDANPEQTNTHRPKLKI